MEDQGNPKPQSKFRGKGDGHWHHIAFIKCCVIQGSQDPGSGSPSLPASLCRTTYSRSLSQCLGSMALCPLFYSFNTDLSPAEPSVGSKDPSVNTCLTERELSGGGRSLINKHNNKGITEAFAWLPRGKAFYRVSL